MNYRRRVDEALEETFAALEGDLETTQGRCPPRLRKAMRHAVFSGGGRIRPALTLRVSDLCGAAEPELASAAAVAIELLHCASLVHDDLPCFDDADQRRGKPTVHVRYGKEIAVLVGDALIVHSFDVVARARCQGPSPVGEVVAELSRGVGCRSGLIAGQAWESESNVDLASYHAAKTAALFEAAAGVGAIAAGGDPEPWRALGSALGRAYQIADDLHDVAATNHEKPVGIDARQGRPNAALHLGVEQAIELLRETRDEVLAAIPPGKYDFELSPWLNDVVYRLVPVQLREQPDIRAMMQSA